MKRYGSVLALLARSSIYKILALLAAATAAECALFGWWLRRGVPEEEGFGLEAILAQSGVLYAFGAAALAVCLALALTGCAFSSRTGYTLRRLQIPEWQVALLQFGYNALALLVLWGWQAAVALGLCRWFAAACPDQTTTQTIFLAFYRSPFLHAVLPLQNAVIWWRNGLLLVTLAATAAAFPYDQRRGRKPLALPMAFALAAVNFSGSLGDVNWVMTLLCSGVLVGAAVYSLCKEEESDEADPAQP